MFQREEAHAAPSDFGQPKSGTDGGASVRSKSENSAAVTGRRRGRHGECAAGRGSGLCKAAGLSDGAQLMADWRSAYHRRIAAAALATSGFSTRTIFTTAAPATPCHLDAAGPRGDRGGHGERRAQHRAAGLLVNFGKPDRV